ncbi:thermonuclease family protein [Haematospirillum jordaniae]|uniref:TNase-like domain-containing protein n=1 Tax=Haematospirillum jordaniae TaxID=1549855 RepID=A0A145VR18_9PROT|nr:thermonuclease family protein [Haematospirillum jordaniae]AMW35867.1 hypothetical protein AY555_10880 [Haematospirillum jordaniae]NKD45767.1 thermonuclease family protein [Haematospirillum jordaniae]NKD57944.1 thermonuclease family protein [Haematospirillum jordaniae]NKD60003.1 thermonuclease family protein [Haematospirillum jordaniae]NKD67969.1 thermonuclease family protein [Haematospirillum jordaniae]
MVTPDGEKIVRFRGLDASEIKGKCAAEKQAALRAKAATEQLLENGRITLEKPSRDKYRRVAAFVLVDGHPVHELLVRTVHGRPCTGDKRRGWCG